ncbi:MAG: chorismate mutase [Sphingomonadales bacterium]|nr:chorismate mutase [Sphingomonadales bacterium]
MIKDPQDCMTMAEVRAGVDHVDEALINLLGQRFGYMAAAARIKDDRNKVRDEVRKAQVIDNAKRHARDVGVPEPLVAALWEMLVERSISYEAMLFDRKSDRSA